MHGSERVADGDGRHTFRMQGRAMKFWKAPSKHVNGAIINGCGFDRSQGRGCCFMIINFELLYYDTLYFMTWS